MAIQKSCRLNYVAKQRFDPGTRMLGPENSKKSAKLFSVKNDAKRIIISRSGIYDGA